jgi:hypothetical protein
MNPTNYVVKDGKKYFYTIKSYDAKNPLGIIKQTLKEYSFYKVDSSENLIGKLYRTEDGNWYDLPTDTSISIILATFLKMAVEESEVKTQKISIL